ncbi:hypothetical protein FMUND_3874 [Fusarium mundagurra]|uniref:Uncharacterized protein n=1 Tax=Fusarium mundagurra TaxID=1567541 RepID=A0A8H6DKN6_9HYPO|nr:hypothetical protein FMUND_3874 [Fusarium mundagurra]
MLWQPPSTRVGRIHRFEKLDRNLPENSKYYGHWGYTIYRTHYSPESDKQWDTLLDALKRQTMLAIGYYQDVAFEDELMHDETGCGGDGQHAFCCPPNVDIPQCGWYGHGNGACQKVTSCPSDMVEIGSNQIYCDNPPMVQTACCKTNSNSMKVYETCRWDEYPDCDTDPKCGDSDDSWPIARSAAGSGGLQCKARKNSLGHDTIGFQERNYCCSQKPGLRFQDCKTYRDVGPMIAGQPDEVCRSGCPSDRVRVAIDWPNPPCSDYTVGGQATCCKTDYNAEVWEPNEKLAAFKEAMDDWIEDEYCPNPSKIFSKRDVLSSSTELAVRADKLGNTTPLELLTRILGLIGTQAMIAEYRRIWNNAVQVRYPWLQTTYMSRYIRDNWRLDYEGPSAFARKVLCYPSYWAALIEAYLSGDNDSDALLLNCTEQSLCYSDGNCGEADDVGNADNKRRHVNLFGRHSNHFAHSSHYHYHHHLNPRLLETRGVSDIKIQDPDGSFEVFQARVPPHPQMSELREGNVLLDNTVVIRDRKWCNEPAIVLIKYSQIGRIIVNFEHVVDKNIFEAFIETSCLGLLPSGVPSTYGAVPMQFWVVMENLDLRLEPNVFQNSQRPSKLSIKKYMTKGNKERKKLKQDVRVVIKRIRATFSLFAYMNLDETRTRLNKIVKDVYVQFKFAENVYNEKHPGARVQIANYWLEWIADHYEKVVRTFKDNISKIIDQINELIVASGFEDGDVAQIRAIMSQFQDLRDGTLPRIDTSGFPAFNSPITADESEDEGEDEDEEMGGT